MRSAKEVLEEIERAIEIREKIDPNFKVTLVREEVIEIRNAIKSGLTFMDHYIRLQMFLRDEIFPEQKKQQQRMQQRMIPTGTTRQWLTVYGLFFVGSVIGRVVLDLLAEGRG
jgi:hypothetical protein